MGRVKQATIEEMIETNFPKEETQSFRELFNYTFIHATDKLRGTKRHKYKPIRSCAQAAYLPELRDAELCNIIGRMKTFKPPGFDKIRIRDLYYNYNALKGVIFKILNGILETGIMPKELKLSIVRPVYKSGKKNDCVNYRSISIISALAHILEKHAASGTQSLFARNFH